MVVGGGMGVALLLGRGQGRSSTETHTPDPSHQVQTLSHSRETIWKTVEKECTWTGNSKASTQKWKWTWSFQRREGASVAGIKRGKGTWVTWAGMGSQRPVHERPVYSWNMFASLKLQIKSNFFWSWIMSGWITSSFPLYLTLTLWDILGRVTVCDGCDTLEES